jgi:hypothetical protein
MGTTTSTIMGTASSYIWGEVSEVSISYNQNKKFITKVDFKFIYVKEGNHYKPISNIHWVADKLIPTGAILQIFKIFRHGDSHIQIFGMFNGVEGLFDVSSLFEAISPLKARDTYLDDLSNDPRAHLPRPRSIYESNTICGMPIKQVYDDDLPYSKSL